MQAREYLREHHGLSDDLILKNGRRGVRLSAETFSGSDADDLLRPVVTFCWRGAFAE